MKKSVLILVLFLSFFGFSQRIHLEIGGTIGFKDEFHYKPHFDVTSKYTEFHIIDVEGFLRVSKLKWGGEIGVGFEKASNYFKRFYDNSKEVKYLNLNRLSLNLSAFHYFIKKSKFKWDLQFGVRNYFNLLPRLYVPVEIPLKVWKLSARVSTNFTFKNVLFGVFYEHDLKSDYAFKNKGANFGFRLGVIY